MSAIKYIVGLLMLSISGSLNAQSLEDHLTEAGNNNPGLKARYADFEAAMQRIAQVNVLPDPKLSFGVFISPVETRVGPQQARIGLSQMFPWFGTLSLKGEMATLQAEAKYQEFLNAKNELFYKVKAAWYPLYEINQTLRFQQDNREILYTFKELATNAIRNGKGSLADAIRVDVMIEKIEVDIQLLEDKRKPLMIHFNRLLNRSDSIQVSVPDTILLPNLNERIEKDSLLRNHPILQALDIKIASAETREKVAKKMGMPSFGVGIDYVIVGQRTDVDIPDNGQDVLLPMVSLSLPIFRAKHKAAAKEAQFIQQSIEASKMEFENSLISSYEMAWFKVNEALTRKELFGKQIEKTQQVKGLLLTSYGNSGADFEEILRLQQQLIIYQIADVKAIKDFHIAMAELDYLTGKSL